MVDSGRVRLPNVAESRRAFWDRARANSAFRNAFLRRARWNYRLGLGRLDAERFSRVDARFDYRRYLGEPLGSPRLAPDALERLRRRSLGVPAGDDRRTDLRRPRLDSRYARRLSLAELQYRRQLLGLRRDFDRVLRAFRSDAETGGRVERNGDDGR